MIEDCDDNGRARVSYMCSTIHNDDDDGGFKRRSRTKVLNFMSNNLAHAYSDCSLLLQRGQANSTNLCPLLTDIHGLYLNIISELSCHHITPLAMKMHEEYHTLRHEAIMDGPELEWNPGDCSVIIPFHYNRRRPPHKTSKGTL